MHEHPHSHYISGWRFRTLFLVICLASLGYLLFAFWGGWSEVGDAVYRTGWFGVTVVLSMSLVNYGLRFLRWQTFLNVLGFKHVPWLNHLKIYIAGFSLTTTPGKAGEALRSVFLKDYGVPYKSSFAAFLAEKIADLLAVALLSCIGLGFYTSAIPLVVAAAIIIGCFAVFVFYAEALHAKVQWSERFRHYTEKILVMIQAVKSCFSAWPSFIGLLLGVIAWAAEGFAFWYLLKVLGYEIAVWNAIFIYSLSLLAGALTFLPGGLGGTELVMLQFLLSNHVAAPDAVAATIIIRLGTLWFAVFLGLIALLLHNNQLDKPT